LGQRLLTWRLGSAPTRGCAAVSTAVFLIKNVIEIVVLAASTAASTRAGLAILVTLAVVLEAARLLAVAAPSWCMA
jgi:hypothetical protein